MRVLNYEFVKEYNTSCGRIPDFGVSTAILIEFGPFRNHVKSRHFPERIDARRQYFYSFLQIS